MRLGCAVALATLLVALLLAWWFAPQLVCWTANLTLLPRALHDQAAVLALSPRLDEAPAAPLRCLVSPRRGRSIASEASGWWLPPGVIRAGLGAHGTLRGAGSVSVPWQLVIQEVPAPRLEVALSPEQANALLASLPPLRVAGLTIAPRLQMLEVATLPDQDGKRRFRIEAAGALRPALPFSAVEIPVTRCVAELSVRWQPASEGWQAQAELTLYELAGVFPPLPGLPAATWRQSLERLANEQLAAALERRRLPSWFPTDLHIAAVVR
ncbi:MAG: hypothetical protein RMM29_04620 [Planctomycetota bacterium]|nr:hypothetical protein [Planctomycetota bacterium]MCX8039860.1 hypothetical protein [Planctomycetota bacterium]MDW8372919.1 hypothetical protein [Planctomycetota bacterium]